MMHSSNSSRSVHVRPRRVRPLVEHLETRYAPAAFTFNNPVIAANNPINNPIAVASHPATSATALDEIEAADDFILTQPTQLQSATFTGLLPLGTPVGNITDVVVEIYRVFPADSNVDRTSGPNTVPAFQTTNVPTRANSPSDIVFQSRDSTAAGELGFSANIVAAVFTAGNSVITGINPKPNQTTGGEAARTGEEVQFNVTFTSPFNLPADHYFFVPQVQLTGNPSPGFLWLAGVRPNATLTPDLQSWIRGPNIEPDWLRIGTDIIGGNPAPTFNGAFSLSGQTLAPQLTSLSLNSVVEGAAGFTLTVTGSNFSSDAVVQFGSTALATTVVSSTQLTAIVPSSLLTNAGTFPVTVTEATGTSSSLSFSVQDVTPVVVATATTLSRSRHTVSVIGLYADSVRELHRVTINWGDSTKSSFSLGNHAVGLFHATHAYRGRAHAFHKITLFITDDDGAKSGIVTLRLFV
jgi:hypothetical protein